MEGSPQAAILVATSYQALNRAVRAGPETLLTDCTVLILFAGFYVEATLNYIIEEIGQTSQMAGFLRKDFPGLQDKLGWYYNEYLAREKAQSKRELYDNGIEEKLRRRFPGFGSLHRFRNDISHGEINSAAKSLATAQTLRRQAKNLVRDLYTIAADAGYDVPRLITYRDAIRRFGALSP